MSLKLEFIDRAPPGRECSTICPVAAGEFYASPFHRCVVDAATLLVRVVRSERRFPDVAAAETEYASLTRALEFVSVGRPRVLFDLRAAPLSGGEAIDAVAARFVPGQLAPFRKAAVLVQSAVGRLQILRMTKDHGAIVQVFDDEQAALAYLGAPGGTTGGGRS